LIADVGLTSSIGTNGGSEDQFMRYEFDQCVQNLSQPKLPSEGYTLSGSLQLEYSAGFSRGGREMIRHR